MTAPTPAVKDDKRKQTIIAVSAVLGVLLTYVLIRRSQSSTATTTAAAPVLANAGDTATAASDATQSALSNVSNQLSALTSTLTAQQTAAATPTGDPLALASSYLAGSGYVDYTDPNTGQADTGGYYAVTAAGNTVRQTPAEQLALVGQGFYANGTPTYGSPVHANQEVP